VLYLFLAYCGGFKAQRIYRITWNVSESPEEPMFNENTGDDLRIQKKKKSRIILVNAHL